LSGGGIGKRYSVMLRMIGTIYVGCKSQPALYNAVLGSRVDREELSRMMVSSILPHGNNIWRCVMENKNNFPDIEPEEMPAFLNHVASEYFKDNQEIMFKLAQCSMYIFAMNSFGKR